MAQTRKEEERVVAMMMALLEPPIAGERLTAALADMIYRYLYRDA
jgi:hypothetical protein